jgi:hypothetical protein
VVNGQIQGVSARGSELGGAYRENGMGCAVADALMIAVESVGRVSARGARRRLYSRLGQTKAFVWAVLGSPVLDDRALEIAHTMFISTYIVQKRVLRVYFPKGRPGILRRYEIPRRPRSGNDRGTHSQRSTRCEYLAPS